MSGEPPGRDDVADMAPEAPGGLVGRAAEVAAIRRMLGLTRLVTVTGLPGVGKTAATLKAAGAGAGSFADGILLVRLDTLRDGTLLPHTIAAALSLEDSFARSTLDVLTGQLRDRHMLLVLDTCEHLLGASAALASALLRACPGLRILATSRELLRVPGESVTVIRPLRLGDAVALFTRRAAQARVRLGAEHRAAAASICGLLDKLPLAIELAARQLAGTRQLSASLARLLSGIEAGEDLANGPDGAGGRHQSLRTAIGWSHQLCTPDERLLWARLSVFTGPFLTRDAEDVCTTSELPDDTVRACLPLLAQRSVLLAERQAEGVRFLLPATLRAYGRQMLRGLGQEEEFTQRHRRWQALGHGV
jgi:predicted ATPase